MTDPALHDGPLTRLSELSSLRRLPAEEPRGLVVVQLLVEPPLDDPPDAPELAPDCPPLSDGMDELPALLLDELPFELLPLLLPALPVPGPPPVMPEHASISIAQATDINHLVIDHSR